MMKYLMYSLLVATLISLVGFAMNPYGVFGMGIRQLNTGVNAGVDYTVLLYQIASWVGLVGGTATLFLGKGSKQQKVIGAIAVGIPLAIFVFRYWFLIGCFLPIFGTTEGCL